MKWYVSPEQLHSSECSTPLHSCPDFFSFSSKSIFSTSGESKKGRSLFLKINAYGRVLLTFTPQPLQLPSTTNMRAIFLALSNSIPNILYLNQSFSASRQNVLMYFLHSPVIHARTSSMAAWVLCTYPHNHILHSSGHHKLLENNPWLILWGLDISRIKVICFNK